MIMRLLPLFTMLLAFGLAITPPIALAQERPALVQVDEVQVLPLNQTRPVLGRIVTKRQGQVATRMGGLVRLVKVDVGDRVKEGDALVELDSEPVQYDVDLANAEFASAEADRVTAEAEIALLENELARLNRLKDSAAFSKAQAEDKERQIAVAKGRLGAATARIGQYQARQQSSRRDLQDMTIRAPYGGVITRRLVSAGAYLRLGDSVVSLIDDQALEIEADIPVDQVQALKPGVEIGVTIEGERQTATVRAVVPEENPLTRTRAVRLDPDFESRTYDLAIAQTVTLHVPTELSRDVPTVSKDGVIQRPNGAIVFLVKDQMAEPQPVRLGAAVDSRFEVLEGLSAGDLVVVRGNERLRPGQPVTYPGAPAAGVKSDEADGKDKG